MNIFNLLHIRVSSWLNFKMSNDLICYISGFQFDSNFKMSNDENIKSVAEYISGPYWQ